MSSSASSSFVGTIAIFQGKNGKYYIYNGVKYDIHFPLEWAVNHIRDPEVSSFISGPDYCENCKYYGTLNGVFVGYCSSCSNEIYNGERPGVLDIHDLTDEEIWAIFPYLNGVSVQDIGDYDEDEYMSQLSNSDEFNLSDTSTNKEEEYGEEEDDDDEEQDTALYNKKRQ